MRIKEIVKHDHELCKITEEVLEMSGEQLINRLNLDHMKSTKQNSMSD